MKYYLLLFLNVLALGANSQNKITYLKMDRTACFGRCPVYTIELMSNGSIYYEGKKNTEFIGKREAKISVAQMQKFMKTISGYKLLSLQNVYKPIAADLPRLNFTFTVNGKAKSIKNGESGPKYLETIGKKIDSLVSTLKWTETKDELSGPDLQIGVGKDKSTFVFVEHEAEFPGGDEALMNYLSTHIVYPAKALELNIQGKVICEFTVTSEGKIKDVKVIKAVGFGLDDEAVRVIKEMPNWKPGTQNGAKVDSKFTLPVQFVLD